MALVGGGAGEQAASRQTAGKSACAGSLAVVLGAAALVLGAGVGGGVGLGYWLFHDSSSSSGGGSGGQHPKVAVEFYGEAF